MTKADRLTEQDIRDWVGDQSFARGLGYYEAGRIIELQRQGDTLKARCQGSMAQPYYVEVELADNRIAADLCSCPIGGGCKHVAALLLTWLRDPAAAREVEALETSLDRLSKPELIALIRDMLYRHPDLETLLELQMLKASDVASADPNAIRRQAERAFYDAGDDWRASYDVARSLRQVLTLGSGYHQRSDWHSAWVIYDTVKQVLIENYGTLYDEEGELLYVLSDCAARLEECLAAQDTSLREAILRTLFDIYRWDIEQGGIGASDDVPDAILRHASVDEKKKVAGWVRSALPSADSLYGEWHRQAYGAFLLDLEEEWLDDEAYLRICRETSRWADLVDRLLVLERLNEAETTAKQRSDYELWQLGDVFVSHGQAEAAEQIVRERLGASDDARLIEWLKTRAIERGDLNEALALAERLFWDYHALTYYREMRTLAGRLGRWVALRDPLLTRLEAQAMFSVLTEIHLDEGHIDKALITYQKTSEQSWWGANSSLRLLVAEAALDGYPREAIRLFEQEVEQLIGHRNRGSYAEAARFLRRIRDVYQRLGDQAGWSAYIDDLRNRYRRLRALKEELANVGL